MYFDSCDFKGSIFLSSLGVFGWELPRPMCVDSCHWLRLYSLLSVPKFRDSAQRAGLEAMLRSIHSQADEIQIVI